MSEKCLKKIVNQDLFHITLSKMVTLLLFSFVPICKDILHMPQKGIYNKSWLSD